jgi:hypothetical protein
MRPRRFIPILVPAVAALFALPSLSAAVAPRRTRAVESDLVPSEVRQPVLDLANKLSRPPEPIPVSAGLKTPFDFDKPAPDEVPVQNSQAPEAPAVKGPREILESVASLIKPDGTFVIQGQPILVFRQRRLKVGDKFTITFDGTDYELELAAIATTSFTLRYKDEETTRPIKSGR